MKLTDTQLTILSKASQRDDLLCEIPSGAKMPPAARVAIARKLAMAGLVEEVRIPHNMPGWVAWRIGDGHSIGLRISEDGLRAIGVEPAEVEMAPAEPPAAPASIDISELHASQHPVAVANAKSWDAVMPRKRKAVAAAMEAAKRGVLPEPPDFSAPTHAPYRTKLARLVKAAQAGDIAALRGEPINPISTSPKALARYRDLCVIAIEANGGAR
jgi:hypothetical protein